MTIKELEALLGMTGANILYYEQEGLLAPHRAQDGCREYSREDIGTLQRIKLLRSLQISLEEIKCLQRGERELDALLAAKERTQATQGQAAAVQTVCRAMREHGVSYPTLDASRYLEALRQGTGESESYDARQDTRPQPFYPWRRYFARLVDITLCHTLWLTLLGLGFRVNIFAGGYMVNLLYSMVALGLLLFLEPLCLWRFGTTPGKWIFGLRLEDESGTNPSYGAGFTRTAEVVKEGMGFGIPIYSLWKLWKSYHRCTQLEPQPWDVELTYTMRDKGDWRVIICALALLLSVGSQVLIFLGAQVPPNRGALTVEKFAENYNILAAFYQMETGRQLDAQGHWQDEALQNGTVYTDTDLLPPPEFVFTLEDGVITGIRFERLVEHSEESVGFPRDQMALTMLSYMGAQPGGFWEAQKAVRTLAKQASSGEYRFSAAGVEVFCQMDYTGYKMVERLNLLFPAQGTDTYFYLQFSMRQQD